MTDIHTLYEDELLLSVYQEGMQDFLVITFGHMGRPGRRTFWGQAALEKLSIPSIGVVPKSPHWYPHENVQRMLASMRPTLNKFRTRITYGFSMGAYAALKYSKAVGATSAIAFSPQISIDPELVGHFDRRYAEYYRDAYHRGLKIEPGDPLKGALVVYDPLMDQDRIHVDMLSQVGDIERVQLAGVGHKTIDVVASTERISHVFDVARTGQVGVAEKLQDALCAWKTQPTA